MKTPPFVRALKARVSPAPVAPWPVQSSFDRRLVDELDTLRCRNESHELYTNARWLMDALDTAVGVQNLAIESLGKIGSLSTIDRKSIEEYLDDVIELLDVCNGLCERMESVQKYIDSLKIVLHYLDGTCEPNVVVITRARVALDSCDAMERRCSELEKCNSDLRKLAQRATYGAKMETNEYDTQLSEVLNGSKAIALFTCAVVGISLSFKSKRGFPSIQSHRTTSSLSSLRELHKEVKEAIDRRRKSGNVVLVELQEAVVATKNLRDLINLRWSENNGMRSMELKDNVEILKRSCGELDEEIKPLEGRVNELYRNLISIRMALLGVISKA